MRTMLRGKVTLLFMMLGLLLAIPAIALADTFQNDVTSTAGQKIVSVQAGQTSSQVGYMINGQNNDPSVPSDTGSHNCNPVQTGTPADVTLTGLPTGVTVQDTNGNTLPAPSTTYHLRFTTCDIFQYVKFNVGSAVAAGDYTIRVQDLSTATPDPGNNDGYNENPAAFTLRVTTPSDTTAPTNASIKIDDDAAWTNNANGNVTVDLSATDNVGVTSYKLAETQAGLATATAQSVSPAEASFSRSNVPFTLTGSEGASKEVWLRLYPRTSS
jgi:hypothetical protein